MDVGVVTGGVPQLAKVAAKVDVKVDVYHVLEDVATIVPAHVAPTVLVTAVQDAKACVEEAVQMAA